MITYTYTLMEQPCSSTAPSSDPTRSFELKLNRSYGTSTKATKFASLREAHDFINQERPQIWSSFCNYKAAFQSLLSALHRGPREPTLSKECFIYMKLETVTTLSLPRPSARAVYCLMMRLVTLIKINYLQQ